MLISALTPEVDPHVTMRPAIASERIDSSSVAGPTCSNTTSTPSLVTSRTALLKLVESNAASAPSSSARFRFASERLVTSTRAPRCFAIWMAATATPAPAPITSTVSPARNCARVVSIRHAVRNVSGKAAASSQLSPAGLRNTLRASIWISSHAAPSECSPSTPKCGQRTFSPARHHSHSQSHRVGKRTTSSPGFQAGSPDSWTTPAPSAAITRGGEMRCAPCASHRSRWLMDAAWMATATEPRPGRVRGRSRILTPAGPIGSSNTAARPSLRNGRVGDSWATLCYTYPIRSMMYGWRRPCLNLRRTRHLIALAAFAPLLLQSAPGHAEQALPPGQKQSPHVRWFYPSQLSYGTVETGTGNTGVAPSPSAFLPLPFMGPHIVTSLFDHCYPDYGVDGQVCRYDGVTASGHVGGPDPSFTEGYAQTPGGHDYLYYDGHDGYDYALTYESVAAAAPGTVMYANWLDPNCHECLSGMTIEINHGNGLLTFYGHLSRIDVAKGQNVRRGQVIGISGMTGTATGPHLHFGVYYVHRSQTPVDPYGWSGSYPDPWPWDLGDLWLTGSPRYADVPLPAVSVAATQDASDPNSIDVSWSSPGGGARFQVYAVLQDGRMKPWLAGVGPGSAVFNGRADQSYWFWVSVTTDLGWTDAGGSTPVQTPRPNHGQAV